jgi:hypothetical protein
MKKESIIASIVLTVVVIAVSIFLWSKITTTSVAMISGEENVAAVARTQITSVGSGVAPDATQGGMYSNVTGGSCGNQSTAVTGAMTPACIQHQQEAVAAWNSFYSANLSPAEANGTVVIDARLVAEGTTVRSKPTLPAYHYPLLNSHNPPAFICKKPMIYTASEDIANGGIAPTYVSTSTQYIYGASSDIGYGISNALGYDAAGNVLANMTSAAGFNYKGWQNSFYPSSYGYCLDAGYVSNYPNYVTKMTAFIKAHNLAINLDSTFFPFGGVPLIVPHLGSGVIQLSGSSTPITAKPTAIPYGKVNSGTSNTTSTTRSAGTNTSTAGH